MSYFIAMDFRPFMNWSTLLVYVFVMIMHCYKRDSKKSVKRTRS